MPCPDITLRSTFIAGFPGETEDDFQQLLDFLVEADLDRVGCFAYSPVEGAVANDITEAVPEEIKQERLQRFMELQAEISTNKLSKKVGQTLQVLVDEIDDEGLIARSKADAPEIDGLVFIETDKQYEIGSLIDVKIIDSSEHDLFAVEVE